jgi:hypothetical protein
MKRVDPQLRAHPFHFCSQTGLFSFALEAEAI